MSASPQTQFPSAERPPQTTLADRRPVLIPVSAGRLLSHSIRQPVLPAVPAAAPVRIKAHSSRAKCRGGFFLFVRCDLTWVAQ